MKIRTVEYAGTIVAPGGESPAGGSAAGGSGGGGPAGELPQVAFSGRSNVGKSSLINTLLRRTRKKIAHVSGTPGKTQALNFYRVNDDFFLVDLPGYGYARVPDSTRKAWSKLIEWYLGESGRVKGVVHLVDARHPPTKHDHRMVEYLAEVGVPTLVVLTKVDKLKRTELERVLPRASEALEVDESQLLTFSSKTGEGRDALLGALADLLNPEEDA